MVTNSKQCMTSKTIFFYDSIDSGFHLLLLSLYCGSVLTSEILKIRAKRGCVNRSLVTSLIKRQAKQDILSNASSKDECRLGHIRQLQGEKPLDTISAPRAHLVLQYARRHL